jgi:hypothetical protein
MHSQSQHIQTDSVVSVTTSESCPVSWAGISLMHSTNGRAQNDAPERLMLRRSCYVMHSRARTVQSCTVRVYRGRGARISLMYSRAQDGVPERLMLRQSCYVAHSRAQKAGSRCMHSEDVEPGSGQREGRRLAE